MDITIAIEWIFYKANNIQMGNKRMKELRCVWFTGMTLRTKKEWNDDSLAY